LNYETFLYLASRFVIMLRKRGIAPGAMLGIALGVVALLVLMLVVQVILRGLKQ